MITLDIQTDLPEICRYMGYGTSTPTEEEINSIAQASDLINTAAEPRYISLRLPIEAPALERLLRGEDIIKHLSGCDTVILLAATLGSGVDALIRKAGIKDITLQLMEDACATALIEKLCDRVESALRKEAADAGRFLTWRFSPGYGDMPIECQKSFVQLLDTPRKMGLTVNNSCILIPTKSVTAIMGESPEPGPGRITGCSICGLKGNCYLLASGTPCHGRSR